MAVRAKMGNTRTRANDGLSFVERMEDNLWAIRDSLANAQNEQKLLADHARQDAGFQVGQKVYVSTKNLPLTYSNVSDQRSRKLQDLFDGPFTIVKASQSPNGWYLDLPKSWNVRQPLNLSLFKRDKSDPTRQ